MNKKVIIYGAGDYGKRLYGFLKELNISVDYFCQTDLKEKKNVFDIEILSVQELIKLRGGKDSINCNL